MTIAVKIHVGGHYVATVKQDGQAPVEIHGDYEGSPNPGGEKWVYIKHPVEDHNINITEKYLGGSNAQ